MGIWVLTLVHDNEGLFERYPWLWNFILFLLGVGLLAVIIWFVRGAGGMGRGGRGFVIYVDEEDVTFKGQFPGKMQGLVSEFLRNDVRVPGSYEIRGHWEGERLVVEVKGAQGMEQRIRNFLKLNLKKPR
jgi:hypothetical protein